MEHRTIKKWSYPIALSWHSYDALFYGSCGGTDLDFAVLDRLGYVCHPRIDRDGKRTFATLRIFSNISTGQNPWEFRFEPGLLMFFQPEVSFSSWNVGGLGALFPGNLGSSKCSAWSQGFSLVSDCNYVLQNASRRLIRKSWWSPDHRFRP
jgi:hypothetical protein